MSRQILSSYEISNIVREVAEKLKLEILKSTHPTLALVVANGALHFSSDVLRALSKLGIDLEYTVVKVKSYKNNKRDNLALELLPSEQEVIGKNIIILDAIYDSGSTLRLLDSHIQALNPASVITCCMLSKSLDLSYPQVVGQVLVSDAFIFGYGLDLNRTSRNIMSIHQAGDTL